MSMNATARFGLALIIAFTAGLNLNCDDGSSGGGSDDGGGNNIKNNPPDITIVSPDPDNPAGREFYRGDPIPLEAYATDPDGDAIVKKGWNLEGCEPPVLDGLTGTCYFPLDSDLSTKTFHAYAIDEHNSGNNAYVDVTPLNNPPVADAGNILWVPKNTDFQIDARNSDDIDGDIRLYELDLEGNGDYEAYNTSGIFNILGGYPIDTCLYCTIKVTDNDEDQNIDVDCIPVGSGTCPNPCP